MTDKFEMPLKLAIKGKNLLSYLEKASSNSGLYAEITNLSKGYKNQYKVEIYRPFLFLYLGQFYTFIEEEEMYNNLIFTAEPFSSPKRVEKISKTLKEKLDDIL